MKDTKLEGDLPDGAARLARHHSMINDLGRARSIRHIARAHRDRVIRLAHRSIRRPLRPLDERACTQVRTTACRRNVNQNVAALRADNTAELSELLQAVFADWLDFGVFIIPPRLTVAADHDEWTRVFAHSKSDLSPVFSALKAGGIEVIEPPQRLGTIRTDRLATWDH